jgi:hypothetical protein
MKTKSGRLKIRRDSFFLKNKNKNKIKEKKSKERKSLEAEKMKREFFSYSSSR